MFKYIVKRIALSILILVAVSLIIYFLVRLMPYDITDSLKNSEGTNEEAIEYLKKSLGLDDNSFKGILKGYFSWLKSIFEPTENGGFISLGKTIAFKDVSSEIASGIPDTFKLAVVTTILEFMIAIPLGITAATHQYSLRDYFVTVVVMIGIALPSFFFGNAFKLIFAQTGLIDKWLIDVLGKESFLYKICDFFIFPPSGTGKIENYVLPIVTVTILSIGGRMRMTRTNMLEVLNSDYIRTARAKGLKERKVINKHAFRNTLIPLVTTLAGLIPSLFSGAIITETIFGLEGIGKKALEYTQDVEIAFIMGYNMFLAVLAVTGILLADIMYAIVDPRVKLE